MGGFKILIYQGSFFIFLFYFSALNKHLVLEDDVVHLSRFNILILELHIYLMLETSVSGAKPHIKKYP